MDHVFAHLLMTYGAKNMVTEFAACLMVTARRHKTLDLRIEVSISCCHSSMIIILVYTLSSS